VFAPRPSLNPIPGEFGQAGEGNGGHAGLEVGAPALHDAVEHQRKVAEGLVTALGAVPGADLPAHGLHRLATDRGQERHEMLAVPVFGQPQPELIPRNVNDVTS
jgi:hypothetical protein